jgi:hypothetical protein
MREGRSQSETQSIHRFSQPETVAPSRPRRYILDPYNRNKRNKRKLTQQNLTSTIGSAKSKLDTVQQVIVTGKAMLLHSEDGDITTEKFKSYNLALR